MFGKINVQKAYSIFDFFKKYYSNVNISAIKKITIKYDLNIILSVLGIFRFLSS